MEKYLNNTLWIFVIVWVVFFSDESVWETIGFLALGAIVALLWKN